jgi:hypothetical protein
LSAGDTDLQQVIDDGFGAKVKYETTLVMEDALRSPDVWEA